MSNHLPIKGHGYDDRIGRFLAAVDRRVNHYRRRYRIFGVVLGARVAYVADVQRLIGLYRLTVHEREELRDELSRLRKWSSGLEAGAEAAREDRDQARAVVVELLGALEQCEGAEIQTAGIDGPRETAELYRTLDYYAERAGVPKIDAEHRPKGA